LDPKGKLNSLLNFPLALFLLILSGCTPMQPTPQTAIPQITETANPTAAVTPTQHTEKTPLGNPPVETAGPMPVDPGSGAPLIAPPASTLRVGDQTQAAGIGTYCWTDASKGRSTAGVCADMIGIPTALEPLKGSSPVHLQFELPNQGTPTELVLTVHAVDAQDEKHEAPTNIRWWQFKPGDSHTLELSDHPSTDLTLTPGLYVLDLFARWGNGNDVSYGFLIQVE
jgi:hypothetical protein